MAAPNIVNVSTITGKTAVQAVSTSATAIVINSAASGKVYKVNSVLVSNVDGTNSAEVTIDLYRSSTAYHLIKTASVPAGSTLDLLAKTIYLEEGDSIRLTGSAASDLEAVCSYEEIDSTSSGAAGVFSTLTATGNTELGDAEATDTHSIKGATTLLANTSSDALRITQTGTGNALVVEDSANPDSTPFVVDNTGRLLIGTSTNYQVGDSSGWGLQLGNSAGISNLRPGDNVYPSSLTLAKTRATSAGIFAIVQNNDIIGEIDFAADDGTDYATKAGMIRCVVDGTPGTNDMPGRLVFSTTAEGASSPTEAMRIDSSGRVGIGTSPDYPLHVSTTYGFSVLIERTNSTDAGIRFKDVNTTDADSVRIGALGNDFRVLTNNTERMRIDSSGVVSINTGYVTLNNNKVGGIQVTIADDAYAEITPPRIGAHFMTITEGGDENFPYSGYNGFVYADFGNSPDIVQISAGSKFETSTSGPPTGTTGNDAHATLFVGGTSGKIYLENRLGFTGVFEITFL